MDTKKVRKEIKLDGKKLSLETGELAFQANMAVLASCEGTVVLATVTSADPNPDLDYWLYSVSYEERLYASGTVKSSRFVKRDGRPTDDSTVRRRSIDHATRPLFPKDYNDEVQIVVTVLSLSESFDPHTLAMIAVSAALRASNIPCEGPMISGRVGYVDGRFLLNPTLKQLEEESELDMLVSFVGRDKRFLAAEAQAKIVPDEKVLEAIEFARDNLDPVLDLIEDFALEANPTAEKYKYESSALPQQLLDDVEKIARSKIVGLLAGNLDKVPYIEKRGAVMDEVYAALEGKYKKVDMAKAVSKLEEHALQQLILEEGKRPDGRSITEIRPISCRVGFLPRTHGSALFTRGVTQSLTTATLASPTLQQIVQDMYGEDTKKFIHYYNFPPYSVGETGRIGSPGSREIGHGALAENALRPVIPSSKDFPYMVLLTSEILSSSGSSSMAAACGGTLALMDAGVPIRDMVAGIGVGLIVNDDMSKQLVMTDLAYMEDAYGFMDFKMAGTKDGVTAIQCDMKLPGVSIGILPSIIKQSREGRLCVLEEMKKIIERPRSSVSAYAPKLVAKKIPVEKIGLVIGAGGKTIKDIEAKTGTALGIEPDGTIMISGPAQEGIDRAVKMVDDLVIDVEVGGVYEGTVKGITDFGAFVEVLPGKEGLLHISEMSSDYVSNVEDILSLGDKITVKVLAAENGKISLSKRALEESRPQGGKTRKW